MKWPSWSANRQREHLLGLRIADLEKQLVDERERTKYFRNRYDRLADLMLVRQVYPQAVASVHHDPPAAGTSIGARLGRVASMVGNHTGVDRSAAARSASESHGLTIEAVEPE